MCSSATRRPPGKARGARSGRTMARTGLRMMPTFPSSPLRFRTAGFPQYGSKAGLSVGAFPLSMQVKPTPGVPCLFSGLLPTFASSVTAPNPRSESRKPARLDAAMRAAHTALPQGTSLRSGLFCPGPSSLNRPHPSHSWARRIFPAMPVIRDAFAVRESLGDPRVVPCFRCPLFPDMPSSTPPECSSAACSQMISSPTTMAFTQVCGARRARHPRHPLRAGIRFRGLLVRLRLFTFATACPFARPPGGSDRYAGTPAYQPTRAFTSALSPGWSPFLAADMTTVLPGRATPTGLSPVRTSASIAAPYCWYVTEERESGRGPQQAQRREEFGDRP
jgi:hypothetical protein